MPFPISYEFKHHAKSDLSESEFVSHLENELLRQRVDVLSTENGITKFKVGLFRLAGFQNAFTVVSSGQISSKKKGSEIELSLKVHFTMMLVIVSIMVFGFMGSFIFMAGFPQPFGIVGLCFGWLWLFGGNYVISIFRLKSWIKALFPSVVLDKSPWWRPRFNSDSNIGKPVTPFEPAWQPRWLLNIRWRWKAPLIIWTITIVWNALMHFVIGFDVFLRAFPFPGLIKFVVIFNLVLLVTVPVFLGLAIERWNDKVVERNKKLGSK